MLHIKLVIKIVNEYPIDSLTEEEIQKLDLISLTLLIQITILTQYKLIKMVV